MLSFKKAITQDLDAQIEQLEHRLESERRRNREEIVLLRQQLVRVTQQTLQPESVLEGRLYNELPADKLTDFVSQTPELLILDVRSDGEWAGGRIPGAMHVPIDQLARRLPELIPHKNKTVLAYCAMGGRSAAACDLLSQSGFMSLFNAGGGIGAYRGDLSK